MSTSQSDVATTGLAGLRYSIRSIAGRIAVELVDLCNGDRLLLASCADTPEPAQAARASRVGKEPLPTMRSDSAPPAPSPYAQALADTGIRHSELRKR